MVRMRRWLRILSLLLGLLVLVGAIAAIWLPRLVDVKIVLDTATKAVEESTGRTLTIKGPASVRIWPRLAVVAENVSFGNAPWARDAEMATAQRVSLSLNWLPLLHQSVSINRAEFDGLTLNLQQGPANGPAGNWILPANQSGSSSAFQLDKLLLQNGTVHWRDASGRLVNTFIIGRMAGVFNDGGLKFKGQDASIKRIDPSGESTELLGINQASGLVSATRAEFKGQVVWARQPIELKGQYDYPDGQANTLALTINTKALDLSRTLSSLPGSSTGQREGAMATSSRAASGQARDAGTAWWQDDRAIDWSVLPQMNLSLDLNAGQVLLPNNVLLPNVVLRGTLSEAGSGRLTLDQFSAGFDKGHISASGAIENFAGKNPAMSINAKASGFDLSKIYAIQDVNLPKVTVQGVPLQLDVSLSAQGSSPKRLVSSLDGHIQASLGSGALMDRGDGHRGPMAVNLQSFTGRFDLAPGKATQMDLDLKATKIDLSPPANANGAPVHSEEGQKNPSAADGVGDQPFWTTPLGFDLIPLLNGSISLRVSELVLPSGITLPNFQVNASMQDAGGGTIRVEHFSSGFDRGQIKASGMLANYAGKVSNPALTLQAKAGGFDLAKLLSSDRLTLPGVSVSGMPVQLDVSVNARGRTPRQLLGTMDGYMQGSVGSGSFVDQGSKDRAYVAVNLQSFTGRADLKQGTSPRLALNLNASKIDLDPHSSASAPPEKSKVKQKSDQTGRHWVFGTQPFGLDAIPLMNGQVGLNINEFVLPDGIILPRVMLKASLQDASGGIMRVDRFETGFGKGTLMADGLIAQYASANPSFRIRGHAKNFRLEELINQMDESKSFGQVKGGQSEFAFHVNGQGSSLRSLVSNLNGEAQLSVTGATLPRGLINSAGDFFVSLVDTINPLATKSATSQVQCVSAYLPIQSGLLSINNTVGIETDQLNVLLNGQIDLKKERMNINIQSAQKSGLTTGVNPAGWIVIEGTLLNPTWGINKTGIAKQAASVGLAVVTSGLSLAAQNLLSVATQKGTCQNILKPWSTIDGQLMSQGAN